MSAMAPPPPPPQQHHNKQNNRSFVLLSLFAFMVSTLRLSTFYTQKLAVVPASTISTSKSTSSSSSSSTTPIGTTTSALRINSVEPAVTTTTTSVVFIHEATTASKEEGNDRPKEQIQEVQERNRREEEAVVVVETGGGGRVVDDTKATAEASATPAAAAAVRGGTALPPQEEESEAPQKKAPSVAVVDDESSSISTNKQSTRTSIGSTPSSRRLPLCTTRQISDGEWAPLALDDGPPYIPIRREDRCHSLPEYQARPFQTWQWQPHDDFQQNKCEFTQWNTHEFCKLMKDEAILFMGDSLSAEHYNAFAELLQLRKPIPAEYEHNMTAEDYYNTTLYPKNSGPSYDTDACNGTVQVILRRNDELQPQRVASLVQQHKPKVLVLNRGAHYKPDDLLMKDVNDEYIPMLHRWQDECKSRGKTCQLIWRTSVPGTPNCNDYTQPNNNLTEMEYAVNQTHNRFHWELFKHQNALIRTALEKEQASSSSSKEGRLVLDVFDAYPIGIRRPDGHCAAYLDKNSDCLHGCLGSRIDVWSQAILHFIKMRNYPRHDPQQQQQQQDQDAQHHQHELLPATTPVPSNNNNNVAVAAA